MALNYLLYFYLIGVVLANFIGAYYARETYLEIQEESDQNEIDDIITKSVVYVCISLVVLVSSIFSWLIIITLLSNTEFNK